MRAGKENGQCGLGGDVWRRMGCVLIRLSTFGRFLSLAKIVVVDEKGRERRRIGRMFLVGRPDRSGIWKAWARAEAVDE